MAEKKKSKTVEVNDNKDKELALETAMDRIVSRYGKGSIMKLGDSPALDVKAISTGAISLDIALGIGGVPRGRIVEIYGNESSGKTTVALHMIAEAQKNGIAAFIDAEHALDPVYARSIGVNTDELILSQPDTGDQALDIVEALVRSNAVDIIVVDSVAALVPKAEFDGDIGDSHVGLHARLMSQALRKLTSGVNKSNTCVVFINQLRMKISPTGFMMGSPETTTGGNALKFYSSVRMEVKRREQIRQKDQSIGNRTEVRIVKNKVAPPFRTAEFEILYGKGISRLTSLLDVAVKADVIHKGGSWYSYEDIKFGQGIDSVKTYLEDNPELALEIEKKGLAHYNINRESTPAEMDEKERE